MHENTILILARSILAPKFQHWCFHTGERGGCLVAIPAQTHAQFWANGTHGLVFEYAYTEGCKHFTLTSKLGPDRLWTLCWVGVVNGEV